LVANFRNQYNRIRISLRARAGGIQIHTRQFAHEAYIVIRESFLIPNGFEVPVPNAHQIINLSDEMINAMRPSYENNFLDALLFFVIHATRSRAGRGHGLLVLSTIFQAAAAEEPAREQGEAPPAQEEGPQQQAARQQAALQQAPVAQPQAQVAQPQAQVAQPQAQVARQQAAQPQAPQPQAALQQAAQPQAPQQQGPPVLPVLPRAQEGGQRQQAAPAPRAALEVQMAPPAQQQRVRALSLNLPAVHEVESDGQGGGVCKVGPIKNRFCSRIKYRIGS
jgi:Tfp pilus assembly protein FimV